MMCIGQNQEVETMESVSQHLDLIHQGRRQNQTLHHPGGIKPALWIGDIDIDESSSSSGLVLLKRMECNDPPVISVACQTNSLDVALPCPLFDI